MSDSNELNMTLCRQQAAMTIFRALEDIIGATRWLMALGENETATALCDATKMANAAAVALVEKSEASECQPTNPVENHDEQNPVHPLH